MNKSQNGCLKKRKHAKFSEKRTFLTPWYTQLRVCAYQGVRTVRFSENLACFVSLKHPFWDSPFYFITDGICLNVLTINFFSHNLGVKSSGVPYAIEKTCYVLDTHFLKPSYLHIILNYERKNLLSKYNSKCTLPITGSDCVSNNTPWYRDSSKLPKSWPFSLT